jgi:hypothetical protein
MGDKNMANMRFFGSNNDKRIEIVKWEDIGNGEFNCLVRELPRPDYAKEIEEEEKKPMY